MIHKGIVSDRPTHYCVVPHRVSTIANELKNELLQQFHEKQNSAASLAKPKKSGLIYDAQEVEPGSGYFKAHVSDHVSSQLKSLDILPSYLQIKESASQKSIVFYNNNAGQCDCHFDRDSSALFLVSGYKEVKIARPMRSSDRPEDGILHEVDPFSSDEKLHGGFQWKTVHMYPGSVFFYQSFGCTASEVLAIQTRLPFHSKLSSKKM